MRGKTLTKLWMCTGGILLAGLGSSAYATINVDGTLNEADYGASAPGTSALSTQTINTSFGDNTVNTGNTGGTELDAGYGVVENGFLYLFLAGNIQNNGNTVQVWIADGAAGGQNTLNAATGAGNMKNANGSIFSPGFNANYALEMNTTKATNANNGSFFVDQYQLNTNAAQNTATFVGSFGLTGGVGNSAEGGSTLSAIQVGVNNTNIGGVIGDSAGGAANQTNAQAVGTGIEIGIPLASLGNPTGNIEVLAAVNGNGDSGFANQFLPGLATGTGSIKKIGNPYFLQGTSTSSTVGLGFTFANTANEFFTVPNTVVLNGNWLPTGSGNWNNTNNWSNSAIPNSVGATASFASATAPSTVTLDINATVGTLNFTNTNAYLLEANSGNTLTLDNGGATATATINDFGGVHTISAPLMLNSNVIVTCENHGDEMTISGDIGGVGGLTVSNSGIFNTTFSALVLTGTNTYQGPTFIQRGELQLGSAGALPVGTALSISAASPHGALDLNGFNATVSSLSATAAGAAIINSSATPGTATLTYAGTGANPSSFVGSISDSSVVNGNLTALTVASGSLTLTGTNSFAGDVTVNSGASLTFASATAGGTAYPVSSNAAPNNVANNGSLVLNDNATVGTITGNGTTTVGAGTTVHTVSINQSGGLVNNGALDVLIGGTVGGITGTGVLEVDSGTIKLAHNSGASTQSVVFLELGTTLDIDNNHLFINYGNDPNQAGDPIASVISMIDSGYAGGSWTGTGITSTAAQANSLSYGIGYSDSADPGNPAGLAPGTIEIMYTLLGDANLDGKVNGTDFAILATNFNQAVGGWDGGDFNYDGKANGSDFAFIASNFNQGASQSAGELAALDAFAAANGLLADVPEPATTALFAAAGLGVLCRRRSRRNFVAI